MSEWREFHISELATSHSAARVPLSKMEREARRGNYPYYGASGVIDYVDNFLFDGEYVLVSEDGENLKTRQTPIAFKAKGKFWVNNHAHVMQGHTEWLNDLLVYYFQNLDLSEYLTGAVQPKLNKANLESIKFFLPVDPDEQRAIASVLSSLDAKNDLLHRQNKTLEAMAEALFRQWFVEEAEEGRSQRPLSTIATYLNGVACQKYPAKDPANRLPVLKIKELSTGITDSSDWATSEIDPKYHVVAGDVIFSWSATLMVKLWDGPKAVLNQHLFKVTSDEFPKWFYFMWTKHHVDEFVAIAESHATTFGHIKRGDLDEAMVLVPGPERLKEMTGVMDPLFEKHITNSAQIKSLTALRDTLLPKLMSGEVRVEMEHAQMQ